MTDEGRLLCAPQLGTVRRMQVEHLEPSVVQAFSDRLATARRRASESMPEARGQADDAAYWEGVFEANAVAMLEALDQVRLRDGYNVRYRFYGRRGGDLLVRPFVARASSDVSTARRVLDWHPPPDAGAAAQAGAPRDAELLYQYFDYPRTAIGAFSYWLAMQELWASQRWVHSTVIADAAQLAAITAGADWRVERPVERVAPAVVPQADGGAQIAVLIHCPLERHAVTFQRFCIHPDQSLELAETILIAAGPRGYLS